MKNFLIILISAILTISLFADIDFAKKLYNDGLIDESIKEFKKVINESPASEKAAEANYYIASGYIKQNKYDKALFYLNRIISSYKNYSKIDLVLSETGKTYLKLKDYKNAVKVFNNLFKTFPLSEYMKNSLKSYADALYLSKDYNNAIITLDKLIKNYPKNPDLPYLYFILSKSYFQDNIPQKSKEIAHKIIKKFPSSNERWETEKFLLSINKPQINDYISKLENLLKKNLPRKYDEEFSFLLSKKYLANNQIIKAQKILEYLIKKYENSQNLCEYLNLLMKTNIKLKQFSKNILTYNNNFKKIPDNKCKTECNLLLAKSYINTKSYDEADKIIKTLIQNIKDDTLKYEVLLLKSDFYIATNRFVPAIKNYLQILQNFPNSSNANYLYFQIAEIYKKNLSDYQKAVDYYSKISPYDKYYTKALMEISSCYEFMKEYEKAVSTLELIDIQTLKNENDKKRIKEKLSYLKNFKLKDYHSAFEDLLSVILQNYDNTNAIKTNIINIYINDLKMYEKALKSCENTTDYYLKCKILLKLLEKSKYEGENYQKYDKLLSANLAYLKNNQEQYLEIVLEKSLLNGYDASTVTKLQDYISKYPSSPATEKFKIYLSEYYISKNQIEKAEKYIINLNPPKKDYRYYKLKIALAEKYYSQDKDSLALNLYKHALKKINLSKPILMFHYCVTLYQTGNYEKAINKLKFLVDNTDFFENKQNIYIFLAKALQNKNDLKNAIAYLNMIPQKYKDDNFYKLLSDFYYQINDLENSKIAIMHIKNKSNELLEKLADLQIKTGEKEMAIYTLTDLISKSKNKIKFYKKLGELYFENKNYKKAAEYLSKYLNLKKANEKETAIHLIISYLKLKNRPKADVIKKQYKKLFDLNDKQILTLNYGIYYLDIDLNTSIKKFKAIINSKKSANEIKYKAYFWRGVAYLKKKNTDLALKDFLAAAKANNKDLLDNVHLKLGTIYFSKEDYENALKNYSYVINNSTNDKLAFDAAKNFAMVCKTTKEWEKAIDTYNLILQRWGNDTAIKSKTLFDIGFSYFRDKKFSKAIKYFKMALPIIDDEDMKAETQYWIGESFFGKENYEQAVTEFLKVYYNYPYQTRWAASAQLKAAYSYIKLGEHQKAKKILNRIIKKYGKLSQWGKQARLYLQEIK